MQRNGHGDPVNAVAQDIPLLPGTVPLPQASASTTVIDWDWDVEHHDRRLEAKADAAMHGAQPFQVDRRVLKDVVREMTGCEVGRIKFMSSGTSSSSSRTSRTLKLQHQGLFIRQVYSSGATLFMLTS